ncbi:bifunctional folylpolyglutamate synthase/dihydrofolate synthase [Sphingomonas sp. SUN019]|uniref:bifunctional folylpolyglutamate synthase/dihydrofolate synthase n=1 Tax=Sphingomonas sp. SUN019 TaxID=2937788 RepID=UPI0021644B47|nr:folylpolyglutamate synthase/dihydrofolate synthase family protein [Sphingomonas sp. SUN019]UVO49304.1 bifunctional folylpolyglutamate synthase/dihydrofolate synthase [Sphingomonas sp. SUN019]
MADHAKSADPAVQAQLDRLWALSPGADVLGLGRITQLLARVGDPHLRLPPVFHVAGTNGKGSTCAFLRASIEAAGLTAHVYSSPHLVRFNERIRLAGKLIDDATLAVLLAEVLDAGGDIGASFFEVTTAAAFLAFARTPADACIVEVGLGGRLDATNIIPNPAVTGIASLGIDHEGFLLAPEAGTPDDPIVRIGFEKAGIAKSGVPLVTQTYPTPVAEEIAAVAERTGATLIARDHAWRAAIEQERLRYDDRAGALDLPLPALAGSHQADNAALAVAMLRHQTAISVSTNAMAEGIRTAHWPARLQRLSPGPIVLSDAPVWLDGGHNPDAGHRIAQHFAGSGAPLHLVIGMLANKDPEAIIGPLAMALGPRLRSIRAVPVPSHGCQSADAFAAVAARHGIAFAAFPDVSAALRSVKETVLIAGSLYLAGEVLRLNDEIPD